MASGVIFDLDGTLADTYDLIVHAFNVAMEPYWRRTWSREEVRSLFGPTEEFILHRELPAAEAERAIERLFSAYQEQHQRLARVFPGVGDMVRCFGEDGYRMGLLTNKGRRSTEITVRALGLERWLGAIVSGDDAPAKPHPDGLLKALDTLGLTPAEAVMVGDAPSDVRAAHAAGCRAVAVTWGVHRREDLLAAHADAVVERVEDLDAAVRQWLPKG